MKYASAAAASAAALGVDVDGLKLPQAFALAAVDVGSGDFGILNYAYSLEQLEVASYIQAPGCMAEYDGRRPFRPEAGTPKKRSSFGGTTLVRRG